MTDHKDDLQAGQHASIPPVPCVCCGSLRLELPDARCEPLFNHSLSPYFPAHHVRYDARLSGFSSLKFSLRALGSIGKR